MRTQRRLDGSVRRPAAALLVVAALALFIAGLGPARTAEADPSKAHDYATVDISTLDTFELTFVPEARKKPILEMLLKGAKWRLKPGVTQAPYCEAMLDKLLAWDGIEIVEPAIRANRYGDPVFAQWRERCPELTPHEEYIVTPPAGTYYGSHHLKAFRIPFFGLEDSKVALFYRQGLLPEHYIDRLGNLNHEKLPNYKPSGTGEYNIVDLNSCQVTGYVMNAPAQGFMYYKQPPGYTGIVESAVLRIDTAYYLLSAALNALTKHAIFNVHNLSNYKDKDKRLDPACRFDAALEQPRQ